MPSILQKQTTRETDPLTLRGDLANTVIPVQLGTTAVPIIAASTTTLSDGEASVGHYIIKVAEVGTAINNAAVYTIQCATGEKFGNGSIDADTYEVDVSITTNIATEQATANGLGTVEAAITANNKIMFRRSLSQVTQVLLAATVNLRLKKREFDLDALAI